jgi:hypothetical protein
MLKRIIHCQKGQSLPIVLALLALGGLTIVPSINYTMVSLNHSRMMETGLKGVYAADAGLERSLWALSNGHLLPDQLSDNINGMGVNLQNEAKGSYTLYLGELVEPKQHSDWLDISDEIVWDEDAQAYKYTVTITYQPEAEDPTIHLRELGARLPPNFSYQPDSATLFPGNLSDENPDEYTSGSGSAMVNWEFDEPRPKVTDTNTTISQAFYITGQGPIEGYYSWVYAARDDIGALSSITGGYYTINATATDTLNGVATAKIVATVLLAGNTTYIVTWQVSS